MARFLLQTIGFFPIVLAHWKPLLLVQKWVEPAKMYKRNDKSNRYPLSTSDAKKKTRIKYKLSLRFFYEFFGKFLLNIATVSWKPLKWGIIGAFTLVLFNNICIILVGTRTLYRLCSNRNRPITAVGQFLSSTFFLTCLESAKCNKTFQSKRTKEAKGPSHEVMALKSPA